MKSSHAVPLAPHQWKPSLERLETLLAEGRASPSALEGWAPPRDLGFLFRMLALRLVRAGPGPLEERRREPAHLLRLAARAAAGGLIPLNIPTMIRASLDRAEALVGEAGAWARDQAMWWAPLPGISDRERIWQELAAVDHGTIPLLSGEHFRQAFGEQGNPSSWLHLPHLLSPPWATAIHAELESAPKTGALVLHRAGVGASGNLSVKRDDSVCYFSGFEPELLKHAPRLAALVQWGLLHLPDWVSSVLPHRLLAAPQRAMLARYPAPSNGYDGHLDNPGGDRDNGRALSLVIYLCDAETPCEGGELALWRANAVLGEEPAALLAPLPGAAVWFDSRSVAHRVLPLRAGPARWALSFWFQDRRASSATLKPSLPPLSLTDILSGVPSPPLPAGALLFHELSDGNENGEITVLSGRSQRPRLGLVSTVYRAGKNLDAWCAHHFSLGFDHILLVFDRLDDPAEAEDAQRLSRRYGDGLLSIWSGPELQRQNWRMPPRTRSLEELIPFALAGSSSSAVAARQTLNATAALRAARGERLGGAPLDWLLHLDSDELFYLEGGHRGGADLHEHFAHAAAAGLSRPRYANHEWLAAERAGEPPLFKCNPRLAIARLGSAGWSALTGLLAMAQTDRRPWFTGYHNGKAAVSVKRAAAAAGVHDWYLAEPVSPSESRFLAGPSVLHFHLASAEAFCRKYLHKATDPISAETGLFPASPVENAAMALIRRARQESWSDSTLQRRLESLYHELTAFSKGERELLEQAGLLFRPRIEHALVSFP